MSLTECLGFTDGQLIMVVINVLAIIFLITCLWTKD